MTIGTMHELFVHTLQDIYFAENRITKALPKMAKKAHSKELRQAFEDHLDESKEHVARLKLVFQAIEVKPKGERCPAIEGIIEEAEDLAKEIDDHDTLDAALIAAAQAVEHYEITRYGTLSTWAAELGLPEAARLLGQTLGEEKAADLRLTKLGELRSNSSAKAAKKKPQAA